MKWAKLGDGAGVASTARVWIGVTGGADGTGGEEGNGVALPLLEEQAAKNKHAARAMNPRSDLFNTLLRFKRPINSHIQAGMSNRATQSTYETIPVQRYRA